ncbi:MAG TPA: exostosin family protein [Polyangiaceae bacterium]|nr:exostosin family protein [Polyangiaceae bacterium]
MAVSALQKVQQCASVDRFGMHTVTDDPNAADVILFVETDQGIGPFATKLRRHPLVRSMPDKCFAYNSSDNPVAHLPGLYASIEKKRFDPNRTRSAHYLSTHITIPAAKSKPMAERTLLYSFSGAAKNAKVRQDLMQLRHARGKCVDVSAIATTVWFDPKTKATFVDEYANLLADTKFALCPRGRGASSMRLFEAMRVGCVPVILADTWVPPSGPDWSQFSVIVAEKDYLSVPRLLEELEPTSEARGAMARQVWLDWFSDEATFHRLVEWCLELSRGRLVSERQSSARWLTLTERFWPGNALTTLRWLKALARAELSSRRA